MRFLQEFYIKIRTILFRTVQSLIRAGQLLSKFCPSGQILVILNSIRKHWVGQQYLPTVGHVFGQLFRKLGPLDNLCIRTTSTVQYDMTVLHRYILCIILCSYSTSTALRLLLLVRCYYYRIYPIMIWPNL